MPTRPSLLDYYRLKRKLRGESCIIRAHHVEIADTLTKLLLGVLPRPNLMVLMPPRCSKTSLAGETFVEWGLSNFPDSEFVYSSYGAELATASTMNIRDTLSSEWYRSLICSQWGAKLPMVKEKAGGRQDHFYTEDGGSVKAVGVGGGITGFGAGKLRPEFGGAVLMDDLLKAQDGRSAAQRKAAFQFVQQTLKSRRNRIAADGPTPMVLIMQRLHPEDPAGMLLREERDQWHVLQLPAQRSDGSSIWEERISAQYLDQLREADPDTYWAQYQQEPSKSSRATFKREWWKIWRDREEVERRITLKMITADTAFSAKDAADFSVFQCWGFEGISGAYLLDQERGQWDFPDLLEKARGFLSRQMSGTPCTEAWIEDAASGISAVQSLRREGLHFRPWKPNAKVGKDKVSRAKQCALPLSAGRVFIPDPTMPGFRWVESFVNEHSAFTDDDSHLYDDQVDACTEALLIWLSRGGGVGPLPVWNNEFRLAA